MNSLQEILSRCQRSGMRMTAQRRIIASVLAGARDHPDVNAVHDRAKAVDERISIATVYRTLRLFDELGILKRREFRDGKVRYEHADRDHHDHLIDLQTGEVIEFVNEAIEGLQRQIAEDLGFDLVAHRLELYGVRKNEAKRGAKQKRTPR